MSNEIFIISAILLSLALFWLFSEMFGVSSYKRAKAVQQILYAKPKRKGDFTTRFVEWFAVPLSKVIPFQSYHLEKVQTILSAANINVPASIYLTRSIVSAGLLCGLCVLASFVVKPMLIAALVIPIVVYITETKKAEKLTKHYRAQIERELPQLVATIATELAGSRDVVRVLKDYMQVAGETLRKELAITVADMETGSYETALTRMETRINSALTSSVLRGLIGAVRGNDEIAYFKMLSYDLKQQEVEMLKKTAQKAIPKINTCSMLLMLCILGMFMGVLVLDLFANSGAIF